MPLSTNLIRGSESLFGLKTEFQLGKTYGTLVFSQQQGEARNIVVQGGGVMQTFKINAIDYEDNQHYFLGQYFLNHYDDALSNYPLINSRISINRLEAVSYTHLDVYKRQGMDDVVHPSNAFNFWMALHPINPKAEIIVFPNDNHNSWDSTYSDPEFYKWMLQSVKK